MNTKKFLNERRNNDSATSKTFGAKGIAALAAITLAFSLSGCNDREDNERITQNNLNQGANTIGITKDGETIQYYKVFNQEAKHWHYVYLVKDREHKLAANLETVNDVYTTKSGKHTTNHHDVWTSGTNSK